jgi:DNA transformation protein
MPVSNDYIEYVRELFEGLGTIRTRRMFGGAGVYCDDLFFSIIVDDELFLKTDETNLPDYLEYGMEPFRYTSKNGRTETMRYYPLPADIMEDNDALQLWARKALDVALRAKRS